MSIDINRLGPAAREQVRRQLEEQRRAREGRDATSSGPAGHLLPIKGTMPSRGKAFTGNALDGGTGEREEGPGGGNKLHAVKTDGYASKHEAERAAELRWMEKAGKIRDLKEQVKFVLTPAVWEEIPQFGKKGQPIKPKRRCVQREQAYFADFVYIDNETGHTVVEDAKGYKGGATYRVFKNKAKVMLDKYGIKVVEV